MHKIKSGVLFVIVAIIILVLSVVYRTNQFQSAHAQSSTNDWPQLQHDAQRTGRTTATMPHSSRARWIWFGPNWILRNKLTKPGVSTWDDDMNATNLSMPTSVPFTFAESMQPIVANNKVFVADIAQQKVWALNVDDGQTLWEAANPGGTAWAGAATSTRVVFTSHYGYVTGYDANTGAQVWQVDTGKAITSSPALLDSTIIVTSQSGYVYAIDIVSGLIKWKTNTGAPITSHPTIYRNRVYVGNEEMYAISLDLITGQELARKKLAGQSFRGLWIVGNQDRVIYHTAPLRFMGSEYVYDNVIDASSGSYANEQQIIRNKLETDWKDFRHIWALRFDSLQNDYTIPLGPVGGVGFAPDPVVLDQADKPITWWPTYFPTISACGFGCREGMGIDLRTFDLTNGNGIALPGKSSGKIISIETDNTFGLTMGGTILYYRQNFRGTRAVDLKNFTSSNISAEYRYRDCGGLDAELNYAYGAQGDTCAPVSSFAVRVPDTQFTNAAGHVGPAVIDNRILFTEYYAVTMMEHY